MTVGLTTGEFILARQQQQNIEALRAGAQHVIDRHDATIAALRVRVRELEAELDQERKARKMAEFHAGRARVAC